MKERPRLLASERGCGWVQSEHDASGEQLGGYEADRCVERRGRVGEEIGHGSRS